MMATRYVQQFDPVAAHSARFADLLRSLTPDDGARRVPGLDWTAAEVGAHVLSVYRRYTVDKQRSATVAALRRQNADDVARAGTDLGAIADGLDEQVALLASVAPHLDPDQTFPFHIGLEVTASAGWANLIGELLVHGDDIARATGRAWTIPDADLEGVWRVLLPAGRGWLRPEAQSVDERYEFRFPIGAVSVHLRDGDIRVDEAMTGPPDHVIERDDLAATTLAFPYRRRLMDDRALALLASRFYDI
jgi:uncharacterized protein (TIGR03083 family)